MIAFLAPHMAKMDSTATKSTAYVPVAAKYCDECQRCPVVYPYKDMQSSCLKKIC
jgi:hypothetical protein